MATTNWRIDAIERSDECGGNGRRHEPIGGRSWRPCVRSSIQDPTQDRSPLDKSRSPLLRNTLYGTLALPRLLQTLNSPYARDDNARVVVLALRSHGLRQAQSLFKKLYKKEGDKRTELQEALDALLCSSQPRRLRECKECGKFFFDRSRRASEQLCDGCREQSVIEEQSANQPVTNIVIQRVLPSTDELEWLFSLGHDSEPKHKGYDFLVNSCERCGHIPRTLLLTLWWVQSNSPFWKNLVDDLPSLLKEVFMGRWREAPQNAAGRKDTTLALAWCIREADHWQALSQELFKRQVEDWSNRTEMTQWEFLDLTYLPPYDLSFLQKVSETAHQSSRLRKHASAYWSRGGITRYAGTITSQGFWTACAGPLALHLRPQIHGKTWDEKQAVPRALWKEILKLWSLRYPERKLPSADALRLRVTPAFFG